MKNNPSNVISQEHYSLWSWFLVHFVKWYLQGGGGYFLKVLILWVVSGVRRQKISQNEKNFCLSHSLSEESFFIIFSFIVHICKMIKSQGIFFILLIFKILIFRVVRGVKGEKRAKMTKKYVSLTPYLRNRTLMIVVFATHL